MIYSMASVSGVIQSPKHRFRRGETAGAFRSGAAVPPQRTLLHSAV